MEPQHVDFGPFGNPPLLKKKNKKTVYLSFQTIMGVYCSRYSAKHVQIVLNMCSLSYAERYRKGQGDVDED